MTVKQLLEWLAKLEDQDAIVEVVEHSSGCGYYDQGGNARIVIFDPEIHAEYTDLRNNPFVSAEHQRKNMRTLLLGEIDA